MEHKVLNLALVINNGTCDGCMVPSAKTKKSSHSFNLVTQDEGQHQNTQHRYTPW